VHKIVLLDTGIVGGILSETDGTSSKWTSLVKEMISSVEHGVYAVPTPVWYEIAQWHSTSFESVQSKISSGCPGIFEYAGYAIANSILMDAAWYKCHVRPKQNNPDTQGAGKAKDNINISMVDALIAAYCLRFGHYVLTLNIKDFPEKFFEIICIENAPSTTDYQRDFIALLKPKLEIWKQSKVPEVALPKTSSEVPF